MENVTVEVLTVRLTTRVSSPTGPPLADNLFWRDSINQVRQHGGRPPPPLSVVLCRPTTQPVASRGQTPPGLVKGTGVTVIIDTNITFTRIRDDGAPCFFTPSALAWLGILCLLGGLLAAIPEVPRESSNAPELSSTARARARDYREQPLDSVTCSGPGPAGVLHSRVAYRQDAELPRSQARPRLLRPGRAYEDVAAWHKDVAAWRRVSSRRAEPTRLAANR